MNLANKYEWHPPIHIARAIPGFSIDQVYEIFDSDPSVIVCSIMTFRMVFKKSGRSIKRRPYVMYIRRPNYNAITSQDFNAILSSLDNATIPNTQ